MAKEELTPAKFVKIHGKATSVFVKHNGPSSHYVNSGHKDGHRFSQGFTTHEEAEGAARELAGRPADGQPLEKHSRNYKGKGQKGAESQEEGYAMPEIERQA